MGVETSGARHLVRQGPCLLAGPLSPPMGLCLAFSPQFPESCGKLPSSDLTLPSHLDNKRLAPSEFGFLLAGGETGEAELPRNTSQQASGSGKNAQGFMDTSSVSPFGHRTTFCFFGTSTGHLGSLCTQQGPGKCLLPDGVLGSWRAASE